MSTFVATFFDATPNATSSFFQTKILEVNQKIVWHYTMKKLWFWDLQINM